VGWTPVAQLPSVMGMGVPGALCKDALIACNSPPTAMSCCCHQRLILSFLMLMAILIEHIC